jgi:CheY-like chemotaxis protein
MLRILVVDDHYHLALALSVALEVAGYFVITAEDGQNALQQLDQNAIDLVITDVHMPVMDGLTLTALIRKRFPDLFVIAISSDPEQGILALERGANLFLSKPFEREKLIRAIGTLSGSAFD